MNYNLSEKVVLITGAASGIGRATALGFARESAKVVVCDINRSAGEETVDEIKDNGGEAYFIQADVSKGDQVQEMVCRTVDLYGRLDCAVNNAGFGLHGILLHEYSETEWDNLLSVLLKGVWLGMKYEIIQMLQQGGGVIVNTSSAAGVEGQIGAAPYSAAKHGVIGLTKTAALEYGSRGIRVNAICPGLTLTPATAPLMAIPEIRSSFEGAHALGRLGKPEEVAAAIMWLCSDQASFVTGHAMLVDGGTMAGKKAVGVLRRLSLIKEVAEKGR